MCGGEVGDVHKPGCPQNLSVQDRLVQSIGPVDPNVGAILVTLAGMVTQKDEHIVQLIDDLEKARRAGSKRTTAKKAAPKV